MNIQLPNLLPAGLVAEVFGGQGHEPLHQMLREELTREWVEPVFARAKTEAATDPGPWTIWDGLYRELDNGRRNLIVLGVGYDHGTFYTRAIRVQAVPQEQLPEAQEALGVMIRQYLDAIMNQHPADGQHRLPDWGLN
jgi:hypothetical protein